MQSNVQPWGPALGSSPAVQPWGPALRVAFLDTVVRALHFSDSPNHSSNPNPNLNPDPNPNPNPDPNPNLDSNQKARTTVSKKIYLELSVDLCRRV